VEATIATTVDIMRDILYDHLEERQKQWHELLIEGKVLQRYTEDRLLCWFAYKSPFPLWNRDTLYATVNLLDIQRLIVLSTRLHL
jgi:hypothetical protein